MVINADVPVAPHELPIADVMKLSPFRLRVDRFLKLNDCLYTTHATQHNRTLPLSLQYLTVTIMQEYHNCFPFGGLEETTRTSSNYVDEDYPARPEIKQSLTG